MKTQSVEDPIVSFSVGLYRALLAAYPAQFRREYSPHMLQVFRDCCLHTVREKGAGAMTRLWALTLLDLTRSVAQQYLQKEPHLSGSQLIRVSGVALMLSSLPYVVQNVSVGTWLIGTVLLVVGILGVRARYGMSAGAFARRTLLAGVIGMFLLYAAIAVFYLGETYLGWLRLEGAATFHPNSLWIVGFGGPFFPLAALALFGASALRTKPLPHLNWLPLATGVWFPIFYSFAATYVLTHAGAFPDQYWNAIFLPLTLLQSFSLVLLGALLVFDPAQELAPA
jgi:hypothetical protein